jgi:hypothetical protein
MASCFGWNIFGQGVKQSKASEIEEFVVVISIGIVCI